MLEQGGNREPARSRRWLGKWITSPRVMAAATLGSLAVGLIGLIPIVNLLLGYPAPGVEFAFGVLITLSLLVSVYAAAQSRRHHTIEMETGVELGELKAQQGILHSQLEMSQRINSEIDKNKRERDNFVSGMFLSLARSRATSSLALHLIRESRSPVDFDYDQHQKNEWQAYKRFLTDYCTHVSRLFSHIKRGKCHCNIKLFFEHEYLDHEFEKVDFGIREELDAFRTIYYITVANCHSSSQENRFVERDCKAVAIAENEILRTMIRTQESFHSNNLYSQITKWEKQTISKRMPSFKYPDKYAVNYRPKIIVAPIYISSNVLLSDNSPLSPFEVKIGAITVDSLDIEGFDSVIDRRYCEQLAYDLASAYLEYSIKPVVEGAPNA